MSDNKELYEPDLISVTDDDGNEIVFELLERYETDDDVYVAITEYHDEAEEIVEADNEVIILKVLEENGEEYLAEIEDEMEAGETPAPKLIEQLDKLETQVEKISVPLSYADELYALRNHIQLVRKKLLRAATTASEKPAAA